MSNHEFTVWRLDRHSAPRWDDFVRSQPTATFFHLSGWAELIENLFGHRCHYLYVERAGHIQAILPLVHMKTRLFGQSLSSLPFAVYGGIVSVDAASRSALEREAEQLAIKLGINIIEYRNLQQVHPEWARKDLYATFKRELLADPEASLLQIPRKQRAVVRKTLDQPQLTAALDNDLDGFYQMLSMSYLNLGTPIFPKRWFAELLRVFGDSADILTIRHQGKPVSAVLNFYFRDQVLPYYGGGGDSARDLKANDFMYWQLMCLSAERGYRQFDFGRSKYGTGSFNFKKNWGFEPEPLFYEYQLLNGAEMPNISPTNPKYELMIRLWQKLPLKVSQLLGPMLAKDLG